MVTLLISEHCHGPYFTHFKPGMHQWMKSLRVFLSLHILSSSLSKLQPSKTLAYSAKIKGCQKLVILKNNEKTKVLLVSKQTLNLHNKSK
jgi:hypothetical protein